MTIPQGTSSAHNATLIHVDVKTLTPAVGQGMNWGGQNYYDTGQSPANLLWQGPSFEPGTRRPMVMVTAGTRNSFQDHFPWSWTPKDYYKGGTATILTGRNAGTVCQIASSTTHADTSDATGTTYVLDRTLPYALTSEDRVQVDAEIPPALVGVLGSPGPVRSIPGWPWDASGSYEIVSGDVPGPSWGTHALHADGAERRFEMTMHFDSSDSARFLTLKGAYSFIFWCKVLSGAPRIAVQVGRTGQPAPYLDKAFSPTGGWQSYVMRFHPAESAATQPGTCDFHLSVDGGSVLLDDLWLGADEDIGFPVRKSYRELLPKLGIVDFRFWDGQGRRFSDWIKPMQYRRPHTASLEVVTSGDGKVMYPQDGQVHVSSLSLPDVVVVAQIAKAPRLHLVADVGWSIVEFDQFMQWAEGDGSDKWSALRIKAGIKQPLSQIFEQVRLSLGNETWGTGMGETDNDHWDQAANTMRSPYMDRFNALSKKVHALPRWNAKRYLLVACVQRGDNYRPAMCPRSDGVEVMQYWGNGPNADEGLQGTTVPQMMDAMLSEIMDRVGNPKNPWYIQQEKLREAGMAQPWVYEFNISPFKSHMTAQTVSLAASLWAGLIDLTLVIEVSKKWPMPGWMFFALPQFGQGESGVDASGKEAGITVPMWGGLRDLEGQLPDTYRPTLLQMVMYNSAAKLGHRVAASCHNPRRTAASVSQTTYDCFTDGNGSYALLLVNNDRENHQSFTLQGLTPTGSMETAILGGREATDHNENGTTVRLVSGTQPAAATISVEPHAAMLLFFKA